MTAPKSTIGQVSMVELKAPNALARPLSGLLLLICP
jgi:hypothetical protein